jgi:hypothetical protein
VMCALYKAVDSVYAVVNFGAVFKNNDFLDFTQVSTFCHAAVLSLLAASLRSC